MEMKDATPNPARSIVWFLNGAVGQLALNGVEAACSNGRAPSPNPRKTMVLSVPLSTKQEHATPNCKTKNQFNRSFENRGGSPSPFRPVEGAGSGGDEALEVLEVLE